MADDTITLKASCLCKSHVYSATIPKSSLPLEAHFCHCDTCRHVTGSLHLSSAVWPSPRSTVDLSGLKIFDFSPTYKIFFCPTCSSQMFGAFNDETKPLDVCTGALDNFPTDQEVVKWTEMGFVDDTLDGGASVWLRDVNASGSALKCLKSERHGEHAKEVPEDWFAKCHNLQSTTERDDVIHIRCKCQGVHFLLHRADYESVSAEDVPWNVDPSTRKLRGELCGCDSCRLHGGTDVFYWTYVEMKYLSFPEDVEKTGFPQDMYKLATLVDKKDPRIGSLAYYKSSAKVQRYFCQTCSATVFYAVSNRPSIIDVAVGLLEMKEGARAESLVAWSLNRGVGYREDGDGGWRQGLFERIGKAAKEYGKKLGSTDKEQQSA